MHALKIVGGRFVVDDHVLWAGQIGEGWWRGQATPKTAVATGGFQVTRWVPGREGPGLTEDLPALAGRMVAQRTPFISTFPGLWYDRRRDEHSVHARQDANVWAPFSEMPWSRSGQGTAWDGLSKFDLSKYNPWYYARYERSPDSPAPWARHVSQLVQYAQPPGDPATLGRFSLAAGKQHQRDGPAGPVPDTIGEQAERGESVF